MAEFKRFKNKDTGEVVSYPAHFADHPVFGLNLDAVDDEIEVDKVVTEGHELPVEQRSSFFAVDEDENLSTLFDNEEDE